MKIKIILPLHCLCLLVVMLPAIWSRAGNWPAWRGPAGTGVCTERDLPLHWSTNENVRWRAPLPERGNSTPIIWGNRVFLTQAIEKQGRRMLLCFDRSNGKQLWQAEVSYAEKEISHEPKPQCS